MKHILLRYLHGSYIDQEGQFLHNMTIFNHFEFYANLHNIDISTDKINEYLKKVNLENIDLKKYPSYLSTGQRKRFLISLALMMNKIIIGIIGYIECLENQVLFYKIMF